MYIHLVNPNTTHAMTVKARDAAIRVAASGTEIVATEPEVGPVSIEGYYDEAFAVPGMLQCIREQNACDGHVIACFDDTGLDASRSIATAPVVGICESACFMAMQIANTFSIVTTLNRSVPALHQLTHRYGVSHRCASIKASEIPVLELENMNTEAVSKLEHAVAAALIDDGAEAIVLGCAGMVDLTTHLQKKFDVPVVDGVTAAVKMVEGLISQGLKTSRVNGYAHPNKKAYAGEFTKYAP